MRIAPLTRSLLLAIALPAIACAAGEGNPDPSFGSLGHGQQTLGFNLGDGNSDQAATLVLRPNLGFYLVGNVSQPDSRHAVGIVRFTADGLVDPAYAPVAFPLGTFEAQINAAALQSDGSLLVAGNYQNKIESFSDAFVCRFTPQGSIDPSFGPADSLVAGCTLLDDANAQAIVVRSDGRIALAGAAVRDDFSQPALLGLLASGKPDLTFGTGGRAFLDSSHDFPESQFLALGQDTKGRLVAAGYLYGISTNSDFMAARFGADGTPDAGFDDAGIHVELFDLGGINNIDRVNALQLLDDDSMVLAGDAQFGAGDNYRSAIVKLTPEGLPSEDFHQTGKATYDGCVQIPTGCTMHTSGVVVRSSGAIVASGTIGTGNTSANNSIFALALGADGAPDAGFVDTTKDLAGFGFYAIEVGDDFVPSAATTMALQDNQLLVAGYATTGAINGDDFAVIRLGVGGNIFSDGFENAP